MADLFNQQISATYSGLLKTTSNGVLSSSLAQITDGRGNGSQLYLSTSKIKFYNAYEFPTNDGSANQVLKTDGSGVLTWEDDANTGTVQVSGTPTANEVAIWTDATTIKGDASFTMSSSTFQVNNSTASSQSNLIISNNDTAINSIPGNILFNSNTLTNYKTLAQIFATKTDADLSDASGKLNFATTDAGTASTKFIINSNGLSEFFGSVNAYNTPSLKLYSLGQEGYFNTEFLEIKKSSTNAILNVNKVGTGSIRGLEFQTGGSPKLTISSGGDVGIGTGTATPSQRLEVRKDDGVSNGLHGITDFNRAGGADAQLLIGYYANGTSVTESTIYSANSLPLSLAAGGSQKLTIGSNWTHNLDAYEEGTWTPTLVSSVGSLTSYTSSGTYTRLGRFIELSIEFTITNNGTGASVLYISNIPFAMSNTTTASGSGVTPILGTTLNVWHYTGAYSIGMYTYNGSYAGSAYNTRLQIGYETS